MDFYSPFWADAKQSLVSGLDLRKATAARVKENPISRSRLYPALCEGFLSWWNEKRRWRNEPFQAISNSRKARFNILELGGLLKINRILEITADDGFRRVIYGYLRQEPLNLESARVGLWILKEAFPDVDQENLRILDVMRGQSYGFLDCPLESTEKEIMLQRYKELLSEWDNLREERRDRLF